jgi:histidinol phosphatase-like PHP family hydrolase
MKKRVVLLTLWIAVSCALAQKPQITDLHFHWEGKASLDKLIEQSAVQGVKLGITGEGGATWGLSGDESLAAFLAKLNGKPVYRGLQVYARDWPKRYSGQVLAGLDYIAADALLFPDRDGRTVALWNPDVSFPDAQDFMERYMAYNLQVLAEPINIWSNPTYLPESLQTQYDRLWTPARMRKLIEAAVKNQVAVEINSKYNIPGLAFLKMAKQLGAKFSFGSNRHDDEAGNLDYCLKMYHELGLAPADLYVPAGPRVR